MAFLDTTPRKQDSDNNLLFKIAQELSNRNGGAYPPRLGDSDNNLLFKIAQLIILGGGAIGTCAADLATCNALTASQAATIAVLQAQIAATQDMQIAWTPTSIKLGERLGYSVPAGTALLGITSITFKGVEQRAGVWINNQSTITALNFPNLTTAGLKFDVFNSNASLTSVSAPLLTSLTGGATVFANAINSSISTISFPSLSSVSGAITVQFNPITLTSVNLPALTTVPGALNIGFNDGISSLSFPSLISTTAGGTIQLQGAALASINFPVLTTVGGILQPFINPALTSFLAPNWVSATGFGINGSTAITTLSFPALTTLSGATGFNASGCTLLANVSFPNYLPSNTRPQNLGSCALTQASVDHVLARCVANAAYVSGTVTLNGGTNSTPSAAGLANKAILVLRGVTVLNN